MDPIDWASAAAGAEASITVAEVLAFVGAVVAVGFAVTGHMSPLLAAILMPVSSLLSLAIVGGGMRRWLAH